MQLPIRYRYGKLDDGRKISFSNVLILKREMVGVERFELPTSCSQSRRATGLRYTPKDIEQHTLHKVVFWLDLDFFCRMC